MTPKQRKKLYRKLERLLRRKVTEEKNWYIHTFGLSSAEAELEAINEVKVVLENLERWRWKM